jgi:rSAM/selenodomain-associated transferase 2
MQSSISVIIPVHDERDGIARAIRGVRSLQGGGNVEIIVVDGHPEGTTLGAIDDGTVIGIRSSKGRGRQMNEGAALAKGEILLFLHADTMLPASAFDEIVSAMRHSDCIGGAFTLKIDSAQGFFRIIEGATDLRARLTRVPYGDQAIFIHRDYFQSIGGYHDIPILEDVDLMWRIRKNGGRIVLLPEAVVTSPRRWEKRGLVRTTLQNRLIMVLYLLGVKPERLARLFA